MDWALDIPGVWQRARGVEVPDNVIAWADEQEWLSRFAREEAQLEKLIPKKILDKLLPHQKLALSKLCPYDRRYLFSPRGSGKSLMGMVWGKIKAASGLPLLVITRAAAKLTIKAEAEKWFPGTEVVVLKTKTAVSERRKPAAKTIYITGWETLSDWREVLVKDFAGAAVVVDEAHMAKSPKRAKKTTTEDGEEVWLDLDNMTASALAICQAAGHVLLMSGTPVPNTRIDLWGQLTCLDRWGWGGKHGFGMRYCAGEHNGYGFEYKGQSETEELKQRLAVVMYTIPQDAVRHHYPPKRRQVIPLASSDVGEPATGLKREIARQIKAAKNGNQEAVESAYELQLQETSSRKRPWLIREVVELLKQRNKVVVFFGRHLDCELFDEELRKATEKLGCPIWMSHGGNSTEQKRETQRVSYMAHDRKKTGCCLIGTGDVWGESVNLQDTDVAYMAMLPYTPRQILQREDRFCRIGGMVPVLIVYPYITGSVEEVVKASLSFDKMPGVEGLLEDSSAGDWIASFKPVTGQSLLERLTAKPGEDDD